MVTIFCDRGMGEDLLAFASREPVDVVVVDCLLMGATAAAREAGLTYVPLEHLFDEYLRNYWMRGPFGQAGVAAGLDPFGALDAAPRTLVASLAELDPGAQSEQPGNLVYTGPVVAAPTALDLGSREPTVLVSLSTFNFPGQAAAMQNILDAVAGLPARVIVTTGPTIDRSDLRAPTNAEIHEYVDHDLLMPQATLVIGHGGHATTMRALAHDLPLVVMPMHPMLDQTMVGTVVERAGAGQLMDKESTASELRPVIERLSADGPHRAAAARLGRLIRESRGAVTAADEILALVRNGVLQG
jgi:UDP:flavonoid glycosyltransferase YjiC (YdhE family)